MGDTTSRLALPQPFADGSDPADVPNWIRQLAAALDPKMAVCTVGTDAARLAAAHTSGGGAFWWSTDTQEFWFDDGTNWQLLYPQGVSMGLLIAMS